MLHRAGGNVLFVINLKNFQIGSFMTGNLRVVVVFWVCVMSAGFWEGRGRILPVAEPLTGQHSVPKIRPLTVITPRDFFYQNAAELQQSTVSELCPADRTTGLQPGR